VFASQAGTPYSYSNLWNRVWQLARDAAGIPGEEVGAFHSFRRTLGSLIHDQGAKSDRQLSDWLGHHDPAFTVREYVGAMDDGLGDAEFLDELIPVDGLDIGASRGQDPTRNRRQNGSCEDEPATHDHACAAEQRQTTPKAGAAS
jgi:hypothetical protein